MEAGGKVFPEITYNYSQRHSQKDLNDQAWFFELHKNKYTLCCQRLLNDLIDLIFYKIRLNSDSFLQIKIVNSHR